ncbi:hypothetical protein BJ165DRAFT_1408232 [Panaeolus papilionaceus]|nr:hypothetical protein BJ165DRAFT_1408232 [Panaeolus papilionaceus]
MTAFKDRKKIRRDQEIESEDPIEHTVINPHADSRGPGPRITSSIRIQADYDTSPTTASCLIFTSRIRWDAVSSKVCLASFRRSSSGGSRLGDSREPMTVPNGGGEKLAYIQGWKVKELGTLVVIGDGCSKSAKASDGAHTKMGKRLGYHSSSLKCGGLMSYGYLGLLLTCAGVGKRKERAERKPIVQTKSEATYMIVKSRSQTGPKRPRWLQRGRKLSSLVHPPQSALRRIHIGNRSADAG